MDLRIFKTFFRAWLVLENRVSPVMEVPAKEVVLKNIISPGIEVPVSPEMEVPALEMMLENIVSRVKEVVTAKGVLEVMEVVLENIISPDMMVPG